MLKTNMKNTKSNSKKTSKSTNGGGGGGVVGNSSKNNVSKNKSTDGKPNGKNGKMSKNGTSGNNESNLKNNKKPSSNSSSTDSLKNVPKVKVQIIEPPKKMERSNSFISRGLSKIYNTLTGSKDDINKISDGDHPVDGGPLLRRSLTIGTISLRKNYRRSMRESRLEQLSEESEKLVKDDNTDSTNSIPQYHEMEVAPRAERTIIEKEIAPMIPSHQQKQQQLQQQQQQQEQQPQYFPEIENKHHHHHHHRHNSSGGGGNGNGSGLFSRLKRTFSITSDKRKSMNPNWSASLQSLQLIDNMVSYDDLSFINYDKFNQYETHLERTLSQMDLSTRRRQQQQATDRSFSHTDRPSSFRYPQEYQRPRYSNEQPVIIDKYKNNIDDEKNGTDVVVKREKKPMVRKVSSFDNNWDSNFDKDKNLYRQSLDKDKLKFLSKVNRESFRLSNNLERGAEELLLLENYLNEPHNTAGCSGSGLSQKNDDTVSSENNSDDKSRISSIGSIKRFLSLPNIVNNELQILPQMLKSRSLTHLDTLEPNMTAQNASAPINQKNKADSGHKICCLSSSPSSTSPIKKKSSSFLHREPKKPILTRSEASSDYFAVYFDTDDREELIPATRGLMLSDALNDALVRRNLSFSQITILDNFQSSSAELGTPPYTSVVDVNTDVGNLIGKRLIVSEKDNFKKSSHHQLQKAASVGSRTKKLFSSASTDESLEQTSESLKSSVPINKQQSKRWSALLGIKNPQQNQLCELLNNYGKNGVPQSKSSYNCNHPDFDKALDYLENIHSSWTAFVNCTGMSETDTKIQSAIWELVTTEVDYIHALQTVTDLFLACLKAIQSENLLIDVDQNKLFSNIREICEANLTFWTMYLYPMVHHSILTGHPMCVDYFQPGFVTFATIFDSYTKYCAEQSTCQYYCRELNRNNGLFTAYLAWCESHKKCNRLRLADILVRPMQRLTKYSLLLMAIRKHINDENDGEIMDAMIHSVENFVCSVNSHLTTRQENERLKGIMARIESYDVVDSNNEHLDKMVKQHSTMFDLCGPIKGCAITSGRHLFMEGDLKFKDNNSKVDVHCFLLTDILLICKTIAKKGHGTLKVIRQPFMTDKLNIKLKENILYCVYLNDFDMAVTAFTLQCPEAKSWYDAIIKARHIYSKLKQGSHCDGYSVNYTNVGSDTLGVKSSPRSVGSSHSGSVELNESRNISIDFEKTNSLSSDEGSTHGFVTKTKLSQNSCRKPKAISSSTLDVKQDSCLRQSLPNLNLNSIHNSHSNTLLVPGTSSTSSGHCNLLSPSHRGISYPPPSPTRATLRRGLAISSSNKNPPLVKTRNVTSQNSMIWSHNPGTPLTSPQHHSCDASIPAQQQQILQTSPATSQQPNNNESDV